MMLLKRVIIIVLLTVLLFKLNGYATAISPTVSIVADKMPGITVLHGLAKLKETLHNKEISFEQISSINDAKGKFILITGLALGDGTAAQLLKANQYTIPDTAEALTIRKINLKHKSTWVAAGYDDKGLMYALLSIADDVRLANNVNNPFSEVNEITEKPTVRERAILLYTMNRAYWESRFYNENYWTKYLDMMSQNRFNMLTVIFGYENGGFLAPPYPYFFDVDGFPGVKMVGLTQQQQQRNLAAFNHLIKMAHDRGIGVTVGIWDHIYRGGIQAGSSSADTATDKPVNGVVTGLNGDNLIAYTRQALTKFIKLIPNLDAINFRMHDESGLKKGEQRSFWLNVFKEIKATTPNLRLVLRAKGLSDTTIQDAIDVGIKFSISTKYWMEQVGLPYHPTHVNKENQMDRRHGYADMLRYPEKYNLTFGLWTGGTNRILLWANPDYAQRFVKSLDIYDTYGYDIAEPLATKMESQPHDSKPFDLLKPPYRYYEYEFERYWHFFQVFGRMGYDPQTPVKTWDKDFDQHFGRKAGPIVEKALHIASDILPRIVATCYPYSYFPTTRGWAEKQRLGDLPVYAGAEGSDIQQFANFDEEAQVLIDKGETPKILPSMNSLWFAQASAKINRLITESQQAIGTNTNKEFNSTVTDLHILSNLALYHSRRIPAAIYYRLFERTHDTAALDSAIANEQNAINAWQQIIKYGGNVYADNIQMGLSATSNEGAKMEMTGSWKDELVALNKGLQALKEKRTNLNTSGSTQTAPHYKPAALADNSSLFKIEHTAVTGVPVGKPVIITAIINADAGVKWARLRYRAVNQYEDFKTLPMSPNSQGVYQTVIPADQINPKWDLMYLIEVMDNKGNGTIYPNLNKETPYVIVKLIR